MLGYIVRRLLAFLPTMLVVITLAFALIHLAPGGPFDRDRALPPEIQAAMERTYHLDWPVFPIFFKAKDHPDFESLRDEGRSPGLLRRITVVPLPQWPSTQYMHYLKLLSKGNLGPSTRYPNTTVGELLRQGFPATFTVGFLSLLLSLGVGLGAGLVAGWKPNSLGDYSSMAVVMVGISVPSFVLAPILLLIFALGFDWFPVAGFSSTRHLALPVICLAGLNAAYIARLSRGSMREIMPQDFIRTARAMGHPEHKVVLVHAMRGAIVPVVSFLGPAIAGVLTGSLVIESIFNIPGIGRYFVQAALNRDYTLVMGTVVLYSIVLLVANLLVDLAYAWLDPRVRYA